MSVETNSHNYTNMNLKFSQFFILAPNSPKENSEALKDCCLYPIVSLLDKQGANGKFLPKSRIFSYWKIPLPRLAPVLRPCEATLLTLLFHLRHPNSKTNEPKFWQILFLQKLYIFWTEYRLKRSCESVPHFLTPKIALPKLRPHCSATCPNTCLPAEASAQAGKAGHHRKILFSLQEKEIGRAQNEKSKEYFSVVWRARRVVVGMASLLGVLLKKCSNIKQKNPYGGILNGRRGEDLNLTGSVHLSRIFKC